MASNLHEFNETLRGQAHRYEISLSDEEIDRLGNYYEMLSRWNPRLHLVAPCSPAEFATRHVLESLLLLQHLPPRSRIADIGSGGGLPIIPCLILRSDLNATLIEASKKKSVFLREALRLTETADQATVIAERFESIQVPEVEFISCRALERFKEILPQLINWAPAGSKLLLFGGEDLAKELDRQALAYSRILIAGSKGRFLFTVT